MANVTLLFSKTLVSSDPSVNPVLIVGQPKNLAKISYEHVKPKIGARVSEAVYNTAVCGLHPSPTDSSPMFMNSAIVAALPTKCSRHNTPSRAHAISKIVKSFVTGLDEFIVMVCERSEVFASACAIARSFPSYTRKTGLAAHKTKVTVEYLLVGSGDRPITDNEVEALTQAARGIQMSAKIVDMPCSEMHTDAFLQEVEEVGKNLGITPVIIRGEELREQGFGGIYNVGKAAVNPPALAVLSHTPPGAKETIAWVGKGIVYDTGGLSIKPKTGMVSMKRDCGGAAGILGAFYAAVKLGFRDNLHAVLCLAENSVGPISMRPDDIITLYSGRTVEVNNTDAEGRLVLGDGVAYAHKHLRATVILDMATLTGAQGTATGKYHAALVTNNEDWESACVKAGQLSGDLVHPLPYCPELHFSEFSSTLADMKNSVADRSNAQSSCAGLFIASHLGFEFPGAWVHVDMASPVHCGERATGYGVALLLVLFGHASHNSLMQELAPFDLENGTDEFSKAKKMRLA